MPSIVDFYNDLPLWARKWGFILLLSATIALSYQYLWPPKVMAPLIHSIEINSERITALENQDAAQYRRMDSTDNINRSNFNATVRWMCAADRKAAIVAGLNCPAQ